MRVLRPRGRLVSIVKVKHLSFFGWFGLDLPSLPETVRLWEHYSGKQGKYLTKKSASLLRSTHRGVCILAGTTDLETQVPRDRPIWGPPKRHEIGEQFALWVWDRPLEKRV